MATFGKPFTREQVEDFLFLEAELLDSWSLPQWRDLFTADGKYYIVTPGVENGDTASPQEVLFLVADDLERLNQRVERLMKKGAHAEYPHSKTRHLVTNVRIVSQEPEIKVRSNFVTYRTKFDQTVVFMGHHIYRLEPEDRSFRIREKRCVLDFDSLSQQGKATILL